MERTRKNIRKSTRINKKKKDQAYETKQNRCMEILDYYHSLWNCNGEKQFSKEKHLPILHQFESFSTFGLIRSNLRNKLVIQIAGKLVFLYTWKSVLILLQLNEKCLYFAKMFLLHFFIIKRIFIATIFWHKSTIKIKIK